MSGRGIVYLVGAGPGDPRLITVLGLDRLRQAEVVVYDRLVSTQLLDEAPPEAERIFVGKAPGEHSARQEEINELLVRHASAGRIVVRLKGGDPFVFGRGSEEALACAQAGIPWEVVPGISSALSVPALAGIPVTHRELAGGFAVVTGHCAQGDRQDWSALARVETLVILMGLSRLPEIAASLLFHGRGSETPVAVIAQGSLPEERTVVGTLDTIAGDVARAGLRAPATIVVGEVVRVRQRLFPAGVSAFHDLAQPELEDHAEILGLLG
ncbi:MAG TPA: uroporphyrinogen-III C-methyltransferase [Thermoanaerobaculia bacterium]|jgi:uroporphyrin-III C-methyltransferase|nr:uroporphyrinogen-III C-methyltransferase [Thermoanaerobaculia bacterium]